MTVNKSYKYKQLRQALGNAMDLDGAMYKLAQLGYRHVGQIEADTHVVTELEGIANDSHPCSLVITPPDHRQKPGALHVQPTAQLCATAGYSALHDPVRDTTRYSKAW
jgi:hypothetical protein